MAKERPTFRTAPWFGKGAAFPLRIDKTTGGMQVTVGSADAQTVGLAYVPDQFSIREETSRRANHIAEALRHVLLTRPGEHDTLPEFGSRLFSIIFDKEAEDTTAAYEVWIDTAAARWEHRVSIPIPEGIEWSATGYGVDIGELGVKLLLQFIRNQVDGNLVAPFVTPRQAREAEYPVGETDAYGHDWCSRYRNAPSFVNGRGVRVRRARRILPIPPRSDDSFYEVKMHDTWLLISYAVYGDIRWWWVIAQCAVQDAAARGESREYMDVTTDPERGLMLRCPSWERVLFELAA